MVSTQVVHLFQGQLPMRNGRAVGAGPVPGEARLMAPEGARQLGVFPYQFGVIPDQTAFLSAPENPVEELERHLQDGVGVSMKLDFDAPCVPDRLE